MTPESPTAAGLDPFAGRLRPRALGGSLLLAAALLGTWFLPATRALWDLVDFAVFRFLNGSLRDAPEWWAVLWAAANHRAFDLATFVITLVFFVVFVRRGGRAARRRLAAGAAVALFIVFVREAIQIDALHVPRESPTRVVDGAVRVSRLVPWIPCKDGSKKCFPGDHFLFVSMLDVFFWFYGGRRWGLAYAPIALLAALPRLVGGAHWLTDDVVGSGAVVSASMGIYLATPLHALLLRPAERLLGRFAPARQSGASPAACVLLCLGAAWVAGGCGGKPRKPERPPNLVLIVADDLGYDDLGCTWTPNPAPGYERIDTPNIDRLASEGTLFTSYYTAAPVCTPARAALMTGCYPPRVGMGDPDPERGDVLFPRSPVGLARSETTLAEVLGRCGYATMIVGKWHLGVGPLGPNGHGFDHWYGPVSRSRRDDFAAMRRDGKVVEVVPHAEITKRYTEEAIAFLRAQRDRPFFLYLAHSMPHTPLAARPEFLGTSARGLYGDVVRELDWSTGEILRALEELGLARDTIVVFTSDNGPAVHLGKLGGKAYPLKGGKGRTDEGGVRVPCIVRWPGKVPAGRRCEVPWAAIDFLPTMAALADAPSPELPIDGVDVSALWFGGEDAPHEAIFYYHRNDLEAVRAGRWKVVFRRTDFQRRLGDRLRPTALYDLVEDVGEERNVQLRHPEIVKRLVRLGERMRQDLGDDKTGAPGPGRRPPERLPPEAIPGGGKR